jgi:hypothetical protein
MNETKLDESKLLLNYDLTSKNGIWKDEHEKILIEWADKAMCYRWLHAKSNQKYSVYNAWFTIPVIIMSTLTGTANFAQDKFPDKYKTLAQVSIGSINILAGILTTIAQFLKISALNEAHRVSAVSWDKFYRNIKVELSKSRTERTNVNQMLKSSKEEFDRLMETSPDIDQNIIDIFQNTFSSAKNHSLKDIKAKKYQLFEHISKPEICDDLVSAGEGMYKDNGENLSNNELEIVIKQKNEIELFENDIKKFITEFTDVHHRQPLDNEVLDNMSDKIPEAIIHKILNRLHTLNVSEEV